MRQKMQINITKFVLVQRHWRQSMRNVNSINPTGLGIG
jgi:hypothetical protein